MQPPNTHFNTSFLKRTCRLKTSFFQEESLGTHFYPKIQTTGKQNTCWITFLGAHGHCEAHNDKFDLYNSDDTPEGYAMGAGDSKEKCLERADSWMKYCDTPVIATYVPGGVSSNWQNDWIMHDSHGGRMFEESEDALNHINPDSLNPHGPVKPGFSEFKSMAPKSPDYHDSPEYRKSLHLQGEEKEAMLASLRARLGMSGAASGVNKDVKQHAGVETGAMAGEAASSSSSSSSSSSDNGYAYAESSSSSYSYSSSSATYEQPTTAAYVETTTTPYETTTTYETTTAYEAPTTTYEAATEAPYEEPPSYTEPSVRDHPAKRLRT